MGLGHDELTSGSWRGSEDDEDDDEGAGSETGSSEVEDTVLSWSMVNCE